MPKDDLNDFDFFLVCLIKCPNEFYSTENFIKGNLDRAVSICTAKSLVIMSRQNIPRPGLSSRIKLPVPHTGRLGKFLYGRGFVKSHV